MKERRTELVLTLDNLNCEEARGSPYVLTSPRSLQACKIVQVKPIELLYRSVDEVRQQLNTFATLDRVLHVYQQQEKTRRSKLELCRAVRDQLVSFSTPNESSSPSPASSIKENLNPSPPSLLIPQDNQDPKRSLTPIGVLKSSKRSISPIAISKRSPSPSVSFKRSQSPVTTKRAPSPADTFTSRKQQLDRENKARARDVATVHEEALKAVENRLVAPSDNKVTAASRSRSPCQSSRSRGQQQLPAVRVSSASSSANRKRSRSRKSTVASRGNVRAEGFHPAVLPSLSRPRPTSRSSEDTSGRPKSGTSSSSAASTATRLASAGSRRLVSSATSARGVTAPAAVGGRSSRTRACAARWTHNTDSNNNSSTGGGGTSKRTASALQQLSGWLTDGVSVPEHDRRILESMALRREEERNAEELAHKAHLTWEMERVLREQELWEQSAHRIRDLEEKRRMEGAHNERKLAELRERESRSQQRLQQTLLEKEARSAAVLRSAGDRKYDEQGELAEECERQKAAVVWAREQLEKEGMLWRHAIQQGQYERLQRAEQARLKVKEVTRRRVASANRVEELRHAERRRMVQAETEETLRLLRAKCRNKEERALILLQRTSGEREKQIRGLSEARATRQQSVREMHHELEAGLARWREQCATLQREASERAERRAAQQQRERQQRAETANRAREEHHSLIMSRVSAEQRALEEARRNAILAKEDKMRRLQQRREQAVHESRTQAYTTAELRDQIKRTISPETFDRLVARSALEARVTASRTPLTGSPPSCTRSHILLG